MKRFFCIILGALCCVSAYASCVFADVLFESGTLGPTGVSWSDLANQSVPGTNISAFAYNGVRFELTEPALTTEIGGHFVAATSGTFFGAIVKLDDQNDFPDSGNLSSPDVLGHALLAFPTSSAEVFGGVELSLDPGWYALMFGSGLFGATTNGGAVRNGTDIGDPSYIAFHPNSGVTWIDVSAEFNNGRFILKGLSVPEPSISAAMIIFAMHIFLSRAALTAFRSGTDLL